MCKRITQAKVMETLDPLMGELYTDLRAITGDKAVACDVRISEPSQRVIFNVRWEQRGKPIEVLLVRHENFDAAVIPAVLQKVREKVAAS